MAVLQELDQVCTPRLNSQGSKKFWSNPVKISALYQRHGDEGCLKGQVERVEGVEVVAAAAQDEGEGRDDERMFMCRRRGIQPASAQPSRRRFSQGSLKTVQNRSRRRGLRSRVVQTCRCCGAAASPPQELRPFLLHGYGPGIGMGMGGMGAFPRLRYLPASIQPSSLLRSHRARSGRFSQPEMPGILLRYVHGL